MSKIQSDNSVRKCYCGSTDFKILKGYSKYQNFVIKSRQIIQCNHCSVITRNPSIYGDNTIEKNIPSALIRGADFIAGAAGKPNQIFIDRLIIVEKMVPFKKVLDIGAGNGSFLKLAESLGWLAVGAELNKDNFDALIREGLSCYDKDIVELGLSAESFSFIHLNHVFEHVKEPLDILNECYRLLIPGGVLIIEVPNEFRSLPSMIKRMLGKQNNSHTGYFEHEWFYDTRSLKNMIAKTGFKIKRIKTLSRAKNSIPKIILNKVGEILNMGAVIEVWLQK